MRLLSNVLSYLLHPLLLPSYALLLINWAHPYSLAQISEENKIQLFASIFINTFAFPAITIFLMMKLDFIKSVHLRTRKERILPYMAIMLYYFFSFLVIRNMAVSEFITKMMLGASIAITISFLLNLFYKISVHAVGAGCFFGIVLALMVTSTYNLFPILIITLFMIGLLGSARIYLKAHRPTDIYSGYMIGLLGQILAYKII